jgi:hypothetical protein
MGESERNMAAIGHLYRYKMAQGNPQGAQQVAFQMLQHYRTAASQYAAIGAAALQQGEVDAGIKALMKSYANIPDDKNLKLWKSKDGQVNFSYKDANGNVIEQGIASPQKLAAAAMKVSENGIEPFIIQAAGERLAGKGAAGKKKAEEDTGGPTEPPGMSKQTYATTLQEVGDHVDKWVEKYRASPEFKQSGKDVTDNEIASMKNAMYHIRRSNDLTDDEAFNAAQKYITAPESKKGEKAPFKVTKDQEAGQATIKYPDGRELSLPMTDYLPMAAARGKALAEAEENRKKAEAEGKKETYGSMGTRAVRAGGDLMFPESSPLAAIGAAGQAVGGALTRAGEPVVEGARRFGADVASGLAATHPGAARVLTNPNNIPPAPDEDRPL